MELWMVFECSNKIISPTHRKKNYGYKITEIVFS